MIGKKPYFSIGIFFITFLMIISSVNADCWWGRCDDELPFNLDLEITQNITNVTYNVTDTNATTECGDNEVLDGSGNCLTLLPDWNVTYNATYDVNIDTANTTEEIIDVFDGNTTLTDTYNSSYEYWTNETLMRTYNASYEWFDNSTIFEAGNTSAEIRAAVDADTNATTECADNQVLDGSGSCLDLLTDWNVTYNATYDAKPDNVYNASYEYTNSSFANLDRVWEGLLHWGNITAYNLNSAWIGALHWGNLTAYNLDAAWVGLLHWGNITGYNLNVAWIGSLDWGNISNAQIVNTSYEWFDNTTIFDMSNSSYEYWDNSSLAWQDNTTIFRRDNSSYEYWTNNSLAWYDNTTIFDMSNASYEYTNASWSLNQIDITECVNCLDGGEIDESGMTPIWATFDEWDLNSDWSNLLYFNNLTKCAYADEVMEMSGGAWSCAANYNYDLDWPWSNSMLAYTNITRCAENQILKTVTGVWVCAADDSAVGDPDTNASTKCSGDQVLNGDNQCVDLLLWWNYTFNDTYDKYDMGNTSTEIIDALDGNLTFTRRDNASYEYWTNASLAWYDNTTIFDMSNSSYEYTNASWDLDRGNSSAEIRAAVDADTNATTECAGTTTYLDGEGNCDDISGVYYDVSGDTLTGNMNMSNQYNATNVYNLTFGNNNQAVIYWNGTNLIISG